MALETAPRATLVIAGNHGQFLDFVKSVGIPRNQAVYIRDGTDLFWYRDCDLYLYGTYYEHDITKHSDYRWFVLRQRNVFRHLPKENSNV